MKILFDLAGRFQDSSITVYAKRLLAGFSENHYKDIYVLCSPEIYDDIKKSFPEYTCIKLNQVYKRLSFFRHIFTCRSLVKKTDYDLILSPHPIPSYCLWLNHKRYVTIFHDLLRLRIDKGRLLWKHRLMYITALIKSRKIIAISENVKDDILRTYRFVPANKITVIYNGINIKPACSKEEPFLQQKYLLYISTLMEYKNVLTLLKAFNILRNDISHSLVIIGRSTPYWEEKVLPYIKKNNLQDRVIHMSNRIDDKTLSQYYQHASLFIHPSLHEGFGYTPIEAAIHEIPVLSSKTTALYETTMGLLNYYESATDERAMAEKIKILLQNPPSAERLKEISLTLQKQYDNKQQAKKIYTFLKDVYQQNL